MPSLQELQALKAQSPAAKNLTDAEFALAVHEHHYKNVPLDTFLSKNGLDPAAVRQQVTGDTPYAKYLEKYYGAQKLSTKPTAADAPGAAEGLLRAFGQGATLGFGDEISSALSATLNGIGSPDYFDKWGQRYAETQAEDQRRLNAYREAEPGYAAIAEFGGSLVPALAGGLAAGAVKGATGLLPRAVGSIGTVLSGGGTGPTLTGNIARGVGSAALTGGLYGFGSSQSDDLGQRLGDAASTGLIAAPFGALAPTVSKLLKPAVISPELAAATKTLKAEGIDQLASQMTGSTSMAAAEARLGGEAVEQRLEKSAKQYTQAILKRMGTNQTDVSQNSVRSILGDFDNRYGAIKPYGMKIDNTLRRELKSISSTYKNSVPQASKTPLIKSVANEINTLYLNGRTAHTGKYYQTLRSKMGQLISSPNIDPITKSALADVQRALDRSVQRQLVIANAPKEIRQDFLRIRNDYRKFMVIADAISKDPLAQSKGLLTPRAVQSAASSINQMKAITGTDDFSKLTQAALLGLEPPTAAGGERLLQRFGAPGVGAALGATLLGPVLTPGIGAVVGGATGYGVHKIGNALRGAALMSEGGQRYLTNQSWMAPLAKPVSTGIAAAVPFMGQETAEDTGLDQYINQNF